MAHVYRVRLDADGASAAEIEALFEKVTPTIEQALGRSVSVVQQVIEIAEGEPEGRFYMRGRRILAPDISEPQGTVTPDVILYPTPASLTSQ